MLCNSWGQQATVPPASIHSRSMRAFNRACHSEVCVAFSSLSLMESRMNLKCLSVVKNMGGLGILA